MDITEESVRPILKDFYKLTLDIQHSNYDRNHRKYQIRNSNQDVLNAFFRSVRVSFEDPEIKKEFQLVVEMYFSRLQAGPLSASDVQKSIDEIENYLSQQKDNILYNRFLSILSEYKM